ncbi:hypothetical protein SSRG_00152 [Streptomyces griseoflavus Tu4000]|uniref:Uncharacterized protein n=1 Tax=Streptomyces griseoflavus Tu4000 TaxID=467200 RepID=D9XKI6_9ACTN|nr:hypothetical protein SSRG_00152 [Streptomyces griseoflavus Tu4000]
MSGIGVPGVGSGWPGRGERPGYGGRQPASLGPASTHRPAGRPADRTVPSAAAQRSNTGARRTSRVPGPAAPCAHHAQPVSHDERDRDSETRRAPATVPRGY